MNIIEAAKAILHGDEEIDPMVIVRAVARLEPVACVDKEAVKYDNPLEWSTYWPDCADESTDLLLYTLEADK